MTNLTDIMEAVEDKFSAEEKRKAEVIRLKAQKDSRIKGSLDKLFLFFYTKLVDVVAWNQRFLQRLINRRNKYSETFIVHDSQRIFAEMMQGDQLDCLKELQVIGARKISDSRMLISFGTYEDDITSQGVRKKPGKEGMFIVLDAVFDTDAPFLKIGMDVWNEEADKVPNN